MLAVEWGALAVVRSADRARGIWEARSNSCKQLYLFSRSVALLPQYHYHTVASPGSGEFALRHILQPFAWPRAPLEDRMQQLDVPITFI